MAQYRICSFCGSTLDPGERCDCGRALTQISQAEFDAQPGEVVYMGRSALVTGKIYGFIVDGVKYINADAAAAPPATASKETQS